jgi:hypothetical protein
MSIEQSSDDKIREPQAMSNGTHDGDEGPINIFAWRTIPSLTENVLSGSSHVIYRAEWVENIAEHILIFFLMVRDLELHSLQRDRTSALILHSYTSTPELPNLTRCYGHAAEVDATNASHATSSTAHRRRRGWWYEATILHPICPSFCYWTDGFYPYACFDTCRRLEP